MQCIYWSMWTVYFGYDSRKDINDTADFISLLEGCKYGLSPLLSLVGVYKF